MAKAFLVDAAPGRAAIPITGVTPQTLESVLAALDERDRTWANASVFKAAAGMTLGLQNPDGSIKAVLFGLGDPAANDADALIAGRLATILPPGSYRFEAGFPNTGLSALAFGLGGYRYGRYKTPPEGETTLEIPATADGLELHRMVAAIALARDLINAPANLMGPAELAAAVEGVARAHGASFAVISGDVLASGFPLIHAVGLAATDDRAPRLIDLTWGDPAAPKVTLVGKGVAFDTGGLDIKPSDAMLLMKKDMGGAANALALAAMIMGAGLKVRLRLLIPAVENSISAAAFRPGDVFVSRKGISVEIGNTDAEGRLILADALALACEDKPELLFDFATLTGAARVALGPDIPAVFTADEPLAADVARHAAGTADPVWRLPLWRPYFAMVESKIADINNAGVGGFAGSITAALFLSRFVEPGIPWLHTDLYAWSRSSRPGRPEGGDAQAIRGLYALLKERYPAA